MFLKNNKVDILKVFWTFSLLLFRELIKGFEKWSSDYLAFWQKESPINSVMFVEKSIAKILKVFRTFLAS